MSNKKIPASPSIKRLPSYLHYIKQLDLNGYEFVSGTIIAEELHVEPIQVRKDLAITGVTGKPKRGYSIRSLISSIEHFLGWDDKKNAIIIGAGNLATALTGYPEFNNHGLNFIAAFDSDLKKIGTTIHGVPVYSIDEINKHIKDLDVAIAILTVPSDYAQSSADWAVKAGIKAIWNFTNTKLKLPDDVICQREDLTSGYAMLCVSMAEMYNDKNNEKSED